MAKLIKKISLVCSDGAGDIDGTQHNKVWFGELYDNDDVITRWGRIRNNLEESLQSKTFPGVGENFLIKKKAEKMSGKKGYTEFKGIDASATTVGPTTAPTVSVNNLHEIAKSQLLKSSSPVLDKLIERLVKSNVHKITSSTNITLNDATGLFQTPLGIVTPDAISEARTILADTLPFVRKADYGTNLTRLVSQYLRLIPQDIGMKFNIQNILPNVDAVQKQEDILQSLEASYKAITAVKPTADGNKTTQEQVFQVDLDIESGREASRIEHWFETSKKAMHGYNNIKITNVYSIKIHDMYNNFLHTDTNKKEVFHGSSMANILSILKSGLKISPPATAAIAGKLFGNGIYGAIHSTKSLGYALNRWGQGGVGDSAFLFVCDFAMGNCYSTTEYGCRKPADKDSIWAKSSSGGLHHDELIVFQEYRVNPRFLIECR